jgi:predicted RNA binding protein YcfA (HicA-like mRNA interferase family)
MILRTAPPSVSPHLRPEHESKPGRVTVPGKPSDDLAPGTLNSIFKQAGLKK